VDVQHKSPEPVGGKARQPCRVEQWRVPGRVGLAPQRIEACDIGQVGQIGGGLEVLEEIGEALPVMQQPSIARRARRRMQRGRSTEPFAAHQPRDGGEIGFERVDATLHHRVAVDGKGRLRGEPANGGVRHRLGREQGLGEGVVKAHAGASNALALSRSAASAMPRSVISVSKAGTLPSRSISVGRAPARAMKRR
jgi:hypothetical protein